MNLVVRSSAIATKIWSYLSHQNFIENPLALITARHLSCIVFTYFIWRFLSINPSHSFLAASYRSFEFAISLGYRLIFCLQPFHIHSSGLRSGLEGGHSMVSIWCWRSHKRDFFDSWMLALSCMKMGRWPNALRDSYHGLSHGSRIWLMSSVLVMESFNMSLFFPLLTGLRNFLNSIKLLAYVSHIASQTMTDWRPECLSLFKQSEQYFSPDLLVTNLRARCLVSKMLSSLKITRIQFSKFQCRCSFAHLRRLRRFIHDKRDLGQATQRRNPAFRRAPRIVVSKIWISSSLANCMWSACLSSCELMTARTNRRTSLALSLGGRPERGLWWSWRKTFDFSMRRIVEVSTSVICLISAFVRWLSWWRSTTRWCVEVFHSVPEAWGGDWWPWWKVESAKFYVLLLLREMGRYDMKWYIFAFFQLR